MKTIGSNILLREYAKEEVAKGGIIIPLQAQKTYWEVVSVGEEVVGVTAGDRVMPRRGKGEAFEMDDTKYLVLHKSEVAVIL